MKNKFEINFLNINNEVTINYRRPLIFTGAITGYPKVRFNFMKLVIIIVLLKNKMFK